MTDQSSTTFPVLPLRDIVVFPHMIVPLFVGRDKSVRALEEVMRDDKQILLSSQIDPSADDPDADGIYRTGVLANVLQLLKLPDGTVKVLVEGDQTLLRFSFSVYVEGNSCQPKQILRFSRFTAQSFWIFCIKPVVIIGVGRSHRVGCAAHLIKKYSFRHDATLSRKTRTASKCLVNSHKPKLVSVVSKAPPIF